MDLEIFKLSKQANKKRLVDYLDSEDEENVKLKIVTGFFVTDNGRI
jgi:hypothetical protein